MAIFGQIGSGANESEKLVGIFIVVGLIGFALWQTVKGILEAKPTPDPWDEATAAELEKGDAVPLCHHCLRPYSPETDFCHECGTPVGQYTNWLPFPQLFSIGHVLRTGTSGDFKRTPLTILGFLMFSVAEYTLFAPIYWILFLRRIFGQRSPETPPSSAATPQ